MGKAPTGALLSFFVDAVDAFVHAAELLVGGGDLFKVAENLFPGPEMFKF